MTIRCSYYLLINYHTLSNNDREFYTMYLVPTNYKAHLVNTFMLEDKHRVQLGNIDACKKYICSLYFIVPYSIIINHIYGYNMFYNNSGDFNLYYNSADRKILFCVFLKFQGPSRNQKDM